MLGKIQGELIYIWYYFDIQLRQKIVVGSIYWNMVYGQMPVDVSKDEEGLQTMKNLGISMAYVLHKINTK